MARLQAKRNRWILFAVFATAFAVRLGHVWQIRRAPFFTVLMGDSRGYDEWAQRIAGGDWMGHDVFYQAPLYPYFLGVIYTVAGRHLVFVRIIQALVGSMSCVLLVYTGRRLFSDRVGIAAGFILALYAPAIFFDGLLQKSVLDVFFICLVLWLIAGLTANTEDSLSPRVPRDVSRGPWTWLWLGAAVGALSLTRENALVFIVVIAAWAFAGADQRPTVGQRLGRVAIFLVGLGLLLVPTAARNSYLGSGFYATTSQLGPNFYIGNNARSNGTYQSLRFGRGAPEYERQDATELAQLALNRRLTPSEVSSYWANQAIEFITSQPWAWLRLVARKFALLWNDTEMVDTEDQATHAEWSWPLRLLGHVARFGVLVPLAIFGVIVSWSTRSRWWILLALGGTYAASVVMFYVFARYRFPMVPFLILLAATGLLEAPLFLRRLINGAPTDDGDSARFRALGRSAPWTLSAVLGVAVFSNWPIVSIEAMRAVTESNLGVALQTEQRPEEAIAHYRRAIALRPDYAPAYSNMATVLRGEKRLDEATAAYEQALHLAPEFATAHFNLANLLLDEGHPEAAADHFQRALRSEPASADVHNNLGVALAATGRLDDAIHEFRRAMEIDPGSAKAHRNLGDALTSQGAQAGAIDAFRRAAELDANDAAIRYDLAGALLEAGRLDEAIAEFRATLRLAPNFVEAHNNLGIALGSQGRFEEAVEEFRAALRIRPGFPDAQRNLALVMTAERAITASRASRPSGSHVARQQ